MPRHGSCRQSTFRHIVRACRTGAAIPIVILGLAASALFSSAALAAQDKTGPTRLDGSGPDDVTVRRPAVRVEELGAPGAGSVGTLGDGNGGLGTDLWRGARLPAVVQAIERLPARLHSATLYDLQRRLLLTAALAPAGQSATTFTDARLRALLKMGATKDVIALAAKAKAKHRKPFPVVRAHFLAGNHKDACAAAHAVETPAAGGFIEKALIACHVLAGHGERAEIALRLSREQGSPVEKSFEAAVMAAVAGEAPDGLGKPYSLGIALLRHSKVSRRRAALDHLSVGALVALSELPAVDRQMRIKALETAADRGAPVDSELAILYAGASVSADTIGRAARIRLRNFDASARTRLYLAAASASDIPNRLQLLSAWWRLAAGAEETGMTGAEMLAARQTVPFLKNVQPAARYQDYAAHIARAYFATGRFAAGLAWYRLLKRAPFRNPADLHRITAAAVLAGPAQGKTIEAWIAHKRRVDPVTARTHIADLKAFLEGLGRLQAFGRVWRGVAGQSDKAAGSPDRTAGSVASRLAALREAAATGRRGVTVLQILNLIGSRSLRDAPVNLLRESIAGLRAVGLTDAARKLAVEAALTRRL